MHSLFTIHVNNITFKLLLTLSFSFTFFKIYYLNLKAEYLLYSMQVYDRIDKVPKLYGLTIGISKIVSTVSYEFFLTGVCSAA